MACNHSLQESSETNPLASAYLADMDPKSRVKVVQALKYEARFAYMRTNFSFPNIDISDRDLYHSGWEGVISSSRPGDKKLTPLA